MEAKIIMPDVADKDGCKINFTVSLQVEHVGVTVTIECKDGDINSEVRRITNGQKTSLKFGPMCNLNVVNGEYPLIEFSLAKTGYLFDIRKT